jgi:hypothetical protein
MSKDYDLSHFCDLAANGICPGASSGAQAASILARVAYVEYLRLDAAARRGFSEWLVCMAADPSHCRDLMEGWGYEF